jgi:hypothetical protein
MKDYTEEYIQEDLLSHYRVRKNKYGQDIKVPVIDARDGMVERVVATQMAKSGNRSKYITFTEYHRSHKQKNNLSI